MSPPNKGLPHRKLEAMARACSEAVTTVLWHTLAEARPADRALQYFLRGRREFGSRDRRLISETTFAVLRWWGWLRRVAPPRFVAALPNRPSRQDSDPPAVPPGDWGACFLGAHLLEGESLPAVSRVWRRQAGVSSKDLEEARHVGGGHAEWNHRLDPLFGDGERPHLRLRDLIPSWAARELDPACPLTELLQWLQKRPPVWVRVQNASADRARRSLGEAGLDIRPGQALPNALALDTPRLNLRTLPDFQKGRIEVQDLASQSIALICAPQPGQRWWDACAGAGGKALHLADLMKGKGAVVATDVRAYKLEDLRRRARRAHFSNIRTRPWDGKALPRKRQTFDGILVDAPCSCSGTWRRNPDGRWTTPREDIAEFAETQLGLLDAAAASAGKDGVLVYATCSMFVRENQAVVRAFLEKHPDFVLDPFPNPFTGEGTDGTLQIWPWDGDCDAMFAARLRRGSGSS